MSTPELTPVKSSNIAAIGHDNGALYVKFNSGAVWRYAGVSPATFEEMRAAESLGSYFARHIKPHHAGEKVEG